MGTKTIEERRAELARLYGQLLVKLAERLEGEPTAADIQVARQFLRDQGYTIEGQARSDGQEPEDELPPELH